MKCDTLLQSGYLSSELTEDDLENMKKYHDVNVAPCQPVKLDCFCGPQVMMGSISRHDERKAKSQGQKSNHLDGADCA